MTRALALALLLPLASCVHGVRVPDPIRRGGGVYVPWDAAHDAHRRDVYACLGFTDAKAPPTMWVARHPLVDGQGRALMAYYDLHAHAIVYAPHVLVREYWLVFRHEIIHAGERINGHGARFTRAAACQFWPGPMGATP